MAALITARHENGKVCHCDANCYNAKSVKSECHCVCGGANHGVGEARARQNTDALNGDWKIVYALRNPDVVEFELYGQFPLTFKEE